MREKALDLVAQGTIGVVGEIHQPLQAKLRTIQCTDARQGSIYIPQPKLHADKANHGGEQQGQPTIMGPGFGYFGHDGPHSIKEPCYIVNR